MTEPEDKGKPTGAGQDGLQPTAAETTLPPQAPPPDEDRTRFAPTSPPEAPAAPAEDADRTRISQSPRAPAAPPPAPAGDDADRTRFAGPAPVAPATAPPGHDPTVFAGAASAAPPSIPPQVSAPLPGPTAAPIQRRADAGPTVRVGTLINNNYEVKEVLKAGGMGEVYRGENVFTGDPVAIKVVLPELAEDEKVGLMFMREARTLSQLSDEAIVRYYNFVKDPAIDRYCLIMEFIKGVPLSEYTAQNGPITAAAAQTLLKRLAKGLDKAHAREVIHRDLSPDNVMLPHGVVAEALLIDFGIAKSNVVKEGTMAGQFAGKFKYVSPEQLGHFGGEIGPQTDVYSLALLMAAAMLGKPLDMGGSIVEAVQRRQAIPDLSELPEEMRPLLAYMLEPDPADRPQSMNRVGHLVDHPEEIPAKYHGGKVPLPRHVPRGGIAGTTPPGLRVPPTAITVSGLQQPPTTGMGALGTQRPTTLPPQPVAKSGGGVLGLLTLVFLGIMGGAGYYAWSNDMIPGLPSPTATEEAATDTEQGASTPAAPNAPPEIQANTREGFLAAFDTGPCTYAARIGAGANAGMVQGFADRPGLFNGLPTAYEEKFGARPAILESLVTADQCPALTLARSLQGRGLEEVSLQLDATEAESGATISGSVVDPQGRAIWLVLITPKGGVYNLTSRLTPGTGGRQDFRFGLSLAQGSAATPQVLLAIATRDPLVNAATARDGSPSSALLPLIAAEVAMRGGQGSAALGHVLLTPPKPAEPAPAETGTDGTAPADSTAPAPAETAPATDAGN